MAPRFAPRRVEGPWAVSFTPGWGAPAQASLPKLISWTEHSDPGIRFYSGTAKYRARFRVDANAADAGPLRLDLGEVREIAQVWVNGRDLGVVWKRPFTVDLTGAIEDGTIKAGWNELEVAVTNLWPNRIIGDQSLPPEKRLTHTNIAKFHADSPLLPSGLLGPVVVESEAEGPLAPGSF
ncbi:MAG: glycosylhydrolase-like jelly roll fold domain-containing protein [Bryobacteraceae bacterium]